MSKRVCLGKIASAHGVKGLVKILPYGEDPSLIEDLGPAYIAEDSAETVTISLKNPSGKYLLASVKGCSDRNRAEELRGTELWYDRDLLPETDEGEFYFDDLVGLTVIEDGQEIGQVTEVNNFGASDLIEITPKGGAPFYFPYAENYIVNVDLDAGTIIVKEHKDFI
jgi:16S rRNA processing protein RimM